MRLVKTNVPGGLGYTYPNPIQQRGKLWLFWRGGGWNPTFSYTRNGKDWVPARELLVSHTEERPYSKYVGDGKTNIHGIFTEGHANHFHNSLYYLRYENNDFFGLSGHKIGSLRNVPFPIGKLERIYKFTPATGSAGRTTSRSPTAAARGSSTRAASTTTTRSSTRTTTASAGSAARSSPPARASRPSPRAARRSTTRTRGSSTSRAAPALSTRSRPWFTPDDGRTWRSRQLTADPDHYCIRPVTPRGLRGAEPRPLLTRRPLHQGLHRLPHPHPLPGGRARRRRASAACGGPPAGRRPGCRCPPSAP